MTCFVISWMIYSVFLCSSSQGRTDCHEKNKEDGEEKLASVTIVSGRICFFLLLLTALSELTCLGFLWWTSFSLKDKFVIEEDCFCSRSNRGQVTENVLLKDGFDIKCPESSDMNCVATYGDLDVLIFSNNSRSNLQLTLNNCQRLDQLEKLDRDCLNYTQFWVLFKMLRIVLPILAVMKLPFLLMNCLEVMSNKMEQNVCSEPEFKVPEVRSPLSLMSPARARAKVNNSPYFGLRLAPLGEEEARQSSLVRHGLNKQNVVGFLAMQDVVTPPRKSEEDFDDGDSVFKCNSISPQSSIADCVISTPIQRGMKSPSFDLSKVIQPVFQHPASEGEEYHYRPPVSAPPGPASTFRSTLPAVLRHQTDLQEDKSGEQDLFSAPVYHFRQPLDRVPVPRSLRLGSLPEPPVPPRLDRGRSKRFSLSKPLSRPRPPSVTDLEETVKTMRSKSVSVEIDWKKCHELPKL